MRVTPRLSMRITPGLNVHHRYKVAGMYMTLPVSVKGYHKTMMRRCIGNTPSESVGNGPSIADVLQAVLTLGTELKELKADINGVEDRLRTELKAEIHGMENRMRNEFKAEINGVRNEFKAEMNGMETRLSGMQNQLDALYHMHKELKSDIGGLGMGLGDLNEAVLRQQVAEAFGKMFSRRVVVKSLIDVAQIVCARRGEEVQMTNALTKMYNVSTEMCKYLLEHDAALVLIRDICMALHKCNDFDLPANWLNAGEDVILDNIPLCYEALNVAKAPHIRDMLQALVTLLKQPSLDAQIELLRSHKVGLTLALRMALPSDFGNNDVCNISDIKLPPDEVEFDAVGAVAPSQDQVSLECGEMKQTIDFGQSSKQLTLQLLFLNWVVSKFVYPSLTVRMTGYLLVPASRNKSTEVPVGIKKAALAKGIDFQLVRL